MGLVKEETKGQGETEREVNGGWGEGKFEPPRLVLLRDFDKML